MNIILTEDEVRLITGYEKPTKQLEVLHKRGFYRAFIARSGGVVLERTHYEVVTQGGNNKESKKSINLGFMLGAT